MLIRRAGAERLWVAEDRRRFACLGMWSNRDDGQPWNSSISLPSIRSVIEENPIRTGSVLLRIRLENFLSFRTGKRMKLVSVQRRMTKICFKQGQSLAHLLEHFRLGGIAPQAVEISLRFRSEEKFTFHHPRQERMSPPVWPFLAPPPSGPDEPNRAPSCFDRATLRRQESRSEVRERYFHAHRDRR